MNRDAQGAHQRHRAQQLRSAVSGSPERENSQLCCIARTHLPIDLLVFCTQSEIRDKTLPLYALDHSPHRHVI